MVSFLQGAITRDTTRIVGAMKEMGFISRRADPEVFDRVVQYFHDKMRGQMSVEGFSLKDLKFEPRRASASLLDLRDLNVSLADLRDAFHIPKEWILLERTLLLLLGVCTTLDPEMNPTEVIEPYLERFLLGEKKQWSEVVSRRRARWRWRRCRCRASCSGSWIARCAASIEVGVRNLDENVRVLYCVGQQLLWGHAGGGRGRPGDGLGGAGARESRLRGHDRGRAVRAPACALLVRGTSPPPPPPTATLTARQARNIYSEPQCVPSWSICLRSSCSRRRCWRRSGSSSWRSLRRRKDPERALSSTPFLLLVVAGGLARFKTGSSIPSLATLGQPWPPVPIYAYGVMLGTSLVGRLVRGDAARQGRRHRPARGRQHLHVDRDLVDHRRARCSGTSPTPDGDRRRHRQDLEGGLVAYGGMIGGFLASWYCCRKRQHPAAPVGRRVGAVGGAGDGHHPHRLFPLRLRLRRADQPALGGAVPRAERAGGARQPGLAAPRQPLSGSRTTRPGRSRSIRRRSTSRWSGWRCSAC